MTSLVVVESPAKAKTLMRILGDRSYVAEATYGHVRDLPESAAEVPSQHKKEKWARLGVNVERDFDPL
jgi:DNA topoisomerase-1